MALLAVLAALTLVVASTTIAGGVAAGWRLDGWSLMPLARTRTYIAVPPGMLVAPAGRSSGGERAAEVDALLARVDRLRGGGGGGGGEERGGGLQAQTEAEASDEAARHGKRSEDEELWNERAGEDNDGSGEEAAGADADAGGEGQDAAAVAVRHLHGHHCWQHGKDLHAPHVTDAAALPPLLAACPPQFASALALAPPVYDPASLDAIHVFAITNTYYTFCAEFLRSAVLQGYVPHIVGFQPFKDREALFNWGNGKPLTWITPAVEALVARGGGHTLVMVADAHDTIMTARAADVACRFRAAQAADGDLCILFTAERACFPLAPEECDRFPPTRPPGLPYRFLNSGGWMGEARDVVRFLRAVDAMYPGGLLSTNVNDQAAAQYLFLNPALRAAAGVELDYEARIFMAMHMQHEILEMAPQQRPPPLDGETQCNTVTGTCPAVLHFNGGSKGMQTGIDDATPAARATALQPDLARWVGDYVVGDVNMTVHAFVCDPRWTDQSAFNKVRPAWLPGCA